MYQSFRVADCGRLACMQCRFSINAWATAARSSEVRTLARAPREDSLAPGLPIAPCDTAASIQDVRAPLRALIVPGLHPVDGCRCRWPCGQGEAILRAMWRRGAEKAHAARQAQLKGN